MKRKNETFSQAIVGLFMIVVLLLLGYFTIVISGVDVMAGRHRIPVRITFSQVGGLKSRDNVMYRGTKIGSIDHVEIGATNLTVVALVDDKVVLRKGCRATVCTLSMLGGYYLKLEEGEGEVLDLSKAIIAGHSPTDLMQDVAEIARNLNHLTSRKEIDTVISNCTIMSERMRETSEKAATIMARVERGEGTVGQLLSSDAKLYHEFDSLVRDARQVLDNFRDTTPISTFSSLATGAL